MENINDCISKEFRNLHNYSNFVANAQVFDNILSRIKYRNIFDKVFNKFYVMDVNIYEKIQNDILNA